MNFKTAGLIIAAMLAGAGPVVADVLVLTDGKRLTGVITKNNPGEPTVTIKSSQGEVAIPRTKISSVQEEPKAVGYGHIAEQYVQSGNFAKASEALEEGLKLDPQNADLLAKKERIGAGLQQKSEVAQKQADADVERAMSRSRDLAKQHKFQDAVDTLRSVDPGPDSALSTKYRSTASDIYAQWGAMRADAQDLPGAIERLQTALKLNPSNEFARNQLVKAFEGDPTKLDEILEHYKDSTVPEDQIKYAEALFKKRDYENALPIFLKYSSDPKYGDPVMQDRIRLMFDMLHRQYADRGEFEKAYDVYANFLQFSPNEDTSPLTRYEFMIRRGRTNPQDMAARAELAKFAEDSGMPDTALEEYENILKQEATNALALAGLKRFADKDLTQARDFYGEAQYVLAQQKSKEVARRYTRFPDIVQAAEELDAKAEIEAAKVRQTMQQQAVALALRGDDYYNQAMAYLGAFTSTERDRTVRVFSPKTEAIKNLERALYAWRQALQLDQSLGAPTSYDLNRKIADAHAKYVVLANPNPPRMPSRDLNRMSRGSDSQGSK